MWPRVIMWFAVEKYLVIHLGKRKYIYQMRKNCVHTERLYNYSYLHYRILRYFSMISHTKAADTTATSAPIRKVRLCWQNTASSHKHHINRLHGKNSDTNNAIFVQLKFGMWKLQGSVYYSWESQSIIANNFCFVFLWSQTQRPNAWDSWPKIDKPF